MTLLRDGQKLPSERVTYDLGITNAGVVRLAPFGRAPMVVVDGTRAQDPPVWIPALPMNTPQWLEGFLAVALAISLTVFLLRRVRAQRSV